MIFFRESWKEAFSNLVCVVQHSVESRFKTTIPIKKVLQLICVCTQVTKVQILKESQLKKGRGSHVHASAKSKYGSIILYGVTCTRTLAVPHHLLFTE